MAEEETQAMPVDDYLKVGLHIGTKFRTKSMQPFIYKLRPDGLNVLNMQRITERIELAAKMIAHYNPDDVLLVCRRENGWKAAEKFSEVTGIRVFVGRYPPGVLTNPKLESFVETKLVFVCDPFPDKNAVQDASRMGIPVIALCDTNNTLVDVDLAVPCNNKGKRSLSLVFWTIAREILKIRGAIKRDSEFNYSLEDFGSE